MKPSPNSNSSLRAAISELTIKVQQKVGQHVENIRNTPVPERGEGTLSLFGLLLVVALVAWRFGGFQILFAELPGLLTGHALEIAKGDHLYVTSLATIAFGILCAIVSGTLVSFLSGKIHGEHSVSQNLSNMSAGNQLGSLMLVVLLEEILARGIFLGTLTMIPFLSGTVGFYILFILGNGFWSLLHLFNFRDPEDRHILRVIPQFIAGIFFTYIFIKYGLIMSVAVHLGYDALLFAGSKRDELTKHDGAITLYFAFAALCAFVFMDKPIADIGQWLHDGNSITYAIAGWSPMDYLKADVFVTMCFSFVFGLLMFDRPLMSQKEEEELSGSPILLMLGALIEVAMVFGCYWAIGFITQSMQVRALVVGVLFACLQREQSGSAVSRAFWCSAPSLMVTLCVMEAVGFQWAVAIVLIEHLIYLPAIMLERARRLALAATS